MEQNQSNTDPDDTIGPSASRAIRCVVVPADAEPYVTIAEGDGYVGLHSLIGCDLVERVCTMQIAALARRCGVESFTWGFMGHTAPGLALFVDESGRLRGLADNPLCRSLYEFGIAGTAVICQEGTGLYEDEDLGMMEDRVLADMSEETAAKVLEEITKVRS